MSRKRGNLVSWLVVGKGGRASSEAIPETEERLAEEKGDSAVWRRSSLELAKTPLIPSKQERAKRKNFFILISLYSADLYPIITYK